MRIERNESTPSEIVKPADKPCGKFKSIGGIERIPAHEFAKPEKPIDFSSIGGKCVHPAPQK